MNKENLKIDPELQSLLPPLSEGEYQQLEDNIVNNGYDKNFPIMVWKGYIADGHNRYKICKDHNITDYTVTTLAYQTKEEVMEWMLDVQLGRRNLNKAQRVLAAEKFREYYERQARENMSEGGSKAAPGKRVVQMDKPFENEEKIDVRKNLSQKAGVGSGTYYRCKTVLNSTNEELKQQMLSGEITINAAYNMVKEDVKKKDETENENIKEVESSVPENHPEELDNNTTISSTHSIDKKTENDGVFIDDMTSNAEVVSEPEDTLENNKDVIKDVFDQSLPILDDKKIEDTKAVYEKELIHKQRNREDMKQVHQVCQELKRDNTVDVFHDRLVGYIKDINFILSSIQNDAGHTLEDLNNCISYVEDFYNSVKEIIENYK